jgi:hypothetical protein
MLFGQVNPDWTVVYSWRLGSGVKVRVTTGERPVVDTNGLPVAGVDPEERIDIRLYKDGTDGLRPWRAGVQLPASHLPHLRRAVEALERHAAQKKSKP